MVSSAQLMLTVEIRKNKRFSIRNMKVLPGLGIWWGLKTTSFSDRRLKLNCFFSFRGLYRRTFKPYPCSLLRYYESQPRGGASVKIDLQRVLNACSSPLTQCVGVPKGFDTKLLILQFPTKYNSISEAYIYILILQMAELRSSRYLRI